MKNKLKGIIAALTLILMLPFTVLPASANSAQKRWQGKSANGVMVTDGECPIIVEHETLTFDIQDLRNPHVYAEESEKPPVSSVTAEYSFYNPSDMEVTATLAFPFGKVSYDDYDADSDKYKITVDGEEIEAMLRHTLTVSSSYNNDFDLDVDLARLLDGYATHDFYNEELRVTKYSFTVGVDGSKHSNARFAFDIDPAKCDNTVYYLPRIVNHYGIIEREDGKLRLYNHTYSCEYTVYVLGDRPEEFPEIKFYESYNCNDSEEIEGYSIMKSIEEMSFTDFVYKEYDEARGVSRMDWYNATVELFGNIENRTVLRSDEFDNGFENSLLCWYQYDLTLAPKGRAKNSVTAPMVSGVDISYDPPIYDYTYLLSPASTWASFGKLDIYINTPYYMTECSLDGFTKTESGYELHLEGLPSHEVTSITLEGIQKETVFDELEFTLCTEEDPEGSGLPLGLVILIGILLLPFIIIGAIIYGIVSLVRLIF